MSRARWLRSAKSPNSVMLAVTLLLVGCATTRGGDRSAYDALAARARRGDRTVDLAQLRTAAGAGGVESDRDRRARLFEAARKEDWKEVAGAADEVLRGNYVDLDAHHYAWFAAKQLGDHGNEEQHQWMEDGLADALTATGDASEARPLVVISIDEEYYLVRALRARPESQALVKCGERMCDRLLTKKVKTGEQAYLYFDVHIPLMRMQARLEGRSSF